MPGVVDDSNFHERIEANLRYNFVFLLSNSSFCMAHFIYIFQKRFFIFVLRIQNNSFDDNLPDHCNMKGGSRNRYPNGYSSGRNVVPLISLYGILIDRFHFY